VPFYLQKTRVYIDFLKDTLQRSIPLHAWEYSVLCVRACTPLLVLSFFYETGGGRLACSEGVRVWTQDLERHAAPYREPDTSSENCISVCLFYRILQQLSSLYVATAKALHTHSFGRERESR
jgi:hypothetical protein